MSSIPVVIAGITGKTGEAVAKTIQHTTGLRLVAGIAKNHAGEHLGARWSDPDLDLSICRDIEAVEPLDYAVLVDFTEAASAFERLQWAIVHQWDMVVGTTGFTAEHRQQLTRLVERYQVGLALIANFSVGAWLLEKVAVEASHFFNVAEIVEEHHESKRDRPSGTARRMQGLLADSWRRSPDDIPVHSIRLPGLIAHQTVVFGAQGQVLSFRHDVHDRSAYAPGVIQAIQKVHALRGRLVDDLGVILDRD